MKNDVTIQLQFSRWLVDDSFNLISCVSVLPTVSEQILSVFLNDSWRHTDGTISHFDFRILPEKFGALVFSQCQKMAMEL